MGAIQQPTPEMGPYTVEIRSESFYLTRSGKPADHADRKGEAEDGSWYFPVAEIPQVLAALAQAAAGPGAGVGQSSAAVWTVGSDGQVPMSVAGPCRAYVDRFVDAVSVSVEIEYKDLPGLTAALATWTPPVE